MKRIGIFAASALACALLLSACGGQTADASSSVDADSSAASQSESATPAPEEPEGSSSATAEQSSVTETVDLEVPGGSAFSLSVSFPADVAEYVTLETGNAAFGDGVKSTSVAFAFSRNGQETDIGTLYLFRSDDYATLDPVAEPIPSQLFEQDGVTVAFLNLQSQPFDPESEEGQMVDAYQAQLQTTLDSITLTPSEG
ncbi:MAG TPA: hypothetical protein H9915_02995 [Candidatus Gemmiger faecigallinarum]|nr:hypothetical protein [Candidatus Gemmiger faecigallinarum]